MTIKSNQSMTESFMDIIYVIFLLLFIKLWSAIKNFSTNLRVDFFCVFTKLDLFLFFFLIVFPASNQKKTIGYSIKKK